MGADRIKLERALPALSLLASWYCLVAGVVVVLFQCLWFAMPVLCFHHSLLVLGFHKKDLELDEGLPGVSNFLKNLRFRKVILPDPSTLIWYWL